MADDERAALKKLQDLADQLDQATRSQRAASNLVEQAKKTTLRTKRAVALMTKTVKAKRRVSSTKKKRR